MNRPEITVRKKHSATFRYAFLAGSFPTRFWLYAVTAYFAVGLLGGCSARQSKTAVLVPVQAMFDGMARRDAAAIKAAWLPGGVLVLVQEGVLSQITAGHYRAAEVGSCAPQDVEGQFTLYRVAVLFY